MFSVDVCKVDVPRTFRLPEGGLSASAIVSSRETGRSMLTLAEVFTGRSRALLQTLFTKKRLAARKSVAEKFEARQDE